MTNFATEFTNFLLVVYTLFKNSTELSFYGLEN